MNYLKVHRWFGGARWSQWIWRVPILRILAMYFWERLIEEKMPEITRHFNQAEMID